MARHEHLPIYKAAPGFTVQLGRVVAGFSRDLEYTLGTELREGNRRVLLQVLHRALTGLFLARMAPGWWRHGTRMHPTLTRRSMGEFPWAA